MVAVDVLQIMIFTEFTQKNVNWFPVAYIDKNKFIDNIEEFINRLNA